MMNKYTNKWVLRYLELSQHISQWSKDPSTRVGAVIVADGKVISTGYNGFPKGMDDSRMVDREFKRKHVVHAEMNAIFNARCDLRGTTLYVSHPPCSECAKLIGAAGIKEIIWVDDPVFAERWNGSEAEDVFVACNIKFMKVNLDEIH